MDTRDIPRIVIYIIREIFKRSLEVLGIAKKRNLAEYTPRPLFYFYTNPLILKVPFSL